MKSWLKKNLFPTYAQSLISCAMLVFGCFVFYKVILWGFIDSIWTGGAQDCRAVSGACIAFIKEKYLYILFGVYPRDYLWRPILGLALWIVFWFHFTQKKNWNKFLLIKFPSILVIYYFLLRGGFGLSYVENHLWGGLPLTILLSTVGILVSYPLGIILALGRQSKTKIISIPSVCYIELIRGVPLISILFMSSVMLPLFLPNDLSIDKLLRAQIAIILFSAAYFAEVVRGGLQSLDKGQEEAAKALGLNYFQTQIYIILPQALVQVIPPTVNTMIGMFKDTSLVIVIALFDLMGSAKSSLSDPNWLGFSIEAYIFIACVYFIVCFSMGQFSKRVEQEFKLAKERG
jgi:general L-amino acid transport system permease protein